MQEVNLSLKTIYAFHTISAYEEERSVSIPNLRRAQEDSSADRRGRGTKYLPNLRDSSNDRDRRVQKGRIEIFASIPREKQARMILYSVIPIVEHVE